MTNVHIEAPRTKDGRRARPDAPGVPDPNFQWWYHAIIDWMLSNPGCTIKQCAEHFDKTYSWMLIIVKSSAFKEQFRRRRAQFTACLDEHLVVETTKLATAGINDLHERITDPMQKRPSFGEVVDATRLALTHLGYGGDQRSGATVVNVGANVVSVNGVTAEDLADARRRLRSKQASAEGMARALPETDDAEVLEVLGFDTSREEPPPRTIEAGAPGSEGDVGKAVVPAGSGEVRR